MANPVKIGAICPSLLGITERRYRQLAGEGVVSKPEKGTVDLLIAIREYIAHLHRRLEGLGGTTLTDERTRLTRISADRKELELRIQKGELLETREAMRIWSGIVATFASRLDAFPRKTAPLLFGCGRIAEMQDVLEKEIHGIKGELSEPDLEAIARAAARDDPGGPPAPAAQAKTDRKRVGGSKPGAESRGQRRVRKVAHPKG